MSTVVRELTAADRQTVFCQATRALPRRYPTAITDAALAAALHDVLGIFGGSCAPGCLCIVYQGAGLKIWGGWHIVNHVLEQPLFSGAATVAMAQEVYGISDPDCLQLGLF